MTVVTVDPIDGDGAVIFCTDALTVEPDVREGPKVRGVDGFHVAVPPEQRKRVVRTGQVRLENWED